MCPHFIDFLAPCIPGMFSESSHVRKDASHVCKVCHTEDGIIEARVSHRKSSQQHIQAGPKKIHKIANELKNNRAPPSAPPVGIVFQFICNFCVFFVPNLCMLLTTFPV